MLNQLLKFTLVSSLLVWLRPRWRGLLALAGAVVMVHVLHSEYLEYVQLSGNDAHLVASYVAKWLVLLLIAAVYVAFLAWGSKPDRDTMPGRRARGKGKTLPKGVAHVDAAKVQVDDGFDFLRRKKHLENRAEKIIADKARSDSD